MTDFAECRRDEGYPWKWDVTIKARLGLLLGIARAGEVRKPSAVEFCIPIQQ